MAEVLVVGASGLLGQYLLAEARARGIPATGTRAHTPIEGLVPADLSNRIVVRKLLRDTKPSLVLLAAAMTDVDRCESEPDLAARINAEAPDEVARECSELGARMVYFSTDYVHDGLSGPSNEEREPNPANVYGRTKLAGERNVLRDNPGFLVVRTSANFGWNRAQQKENSVTWILNRLRRKEETHLFEDQWVSPSYVPEVARVTFDLVTKQGSGIFHVASRDCVTRFEMGRAVCGVFGLPLALLRISTVKDANLLAPRPLRSCLHVGKVERFLDIRLGTFREGVEAMRRSE